MLLSKFPVVASRDFEQTEDFGRRIFGYRTITLVDSPGNFRFRINAAPLGALTIVYSDCTAALDFDLGEHDEAYYAVFRFDGRDNYQVGRQQCSLARNRFAVIPARVYIKVRSLANQGGVAVRFDRQRLERELAKILGDAQPQPIPYCPALSNDHDFVRSFIRYTRYLAVELNRSDSFLLASPNSAEHAANALTTILLEGHPAIAPRILQATSRLGSNYQVRRVEEFVRSQLDQPLSMGDLAAVAGLSVSALHEQFRRHRQCAPMQFVRKLRLEAVRRDLMSGKPVRSVTEVAYRWGFVHLGRFADHYRRMFGESPSATLKRHRP